jgi:hypothetical protein
MVKTIESAICIVCVLPYLCKRPYSAPVESGLIGGWKYGFVVRLIRGVLEEFKHGVLFIQMLFGNEFIVMMVDLYIHLLIWK